MKIRVFEIVRKNPVLFVVSLLAFSLFYSFFYGLFTLPILETGFIRNVAPGAFDYFYIASASILSAFLVTLARHSLNNASKASLFGVSTGAFAAICPQCLGINLLFLGSITTIPLAFLVPYATWLQIAGLIMLASGVLMAIKSISLSCPVKMATHKNGNFSKIGASRGYLLLIIFIAAFLILGYQVTPLVIGSASKSPVTVGGTNLDVDGIVSQVLPESGFTIDATWGDSISKMVQSGVLDVDKLDSLLASRYNQPLTAEQRTLLTSDSSNKKLTINSKNAVFMMYMLWALAKSNDNAILHGSPFAGSFRNYDIGVGKAGYGDTKLIELTPEQQEIAQYVAMNSYRPCCNNPTGRPDCSHGFSALGLVELMASQGYSKHQIFDAFVKFNSFWFPSTYIQDAMYFKLAENKDWNDVDMDLVAGQQYSSLSGAYAVKKHLQDLGL